LVVSIDDTNGLEVYKDGVSVYTKADEVDMRGNTNSLFMFGNCSDFIIKNTDRSYTLSNLRIFNRKLSDAEVTTLQVNNAAHTAKAQFNVYDLACADLVNEKYTNKAQGKYSTVLLDSSFDNFNPVKGITPLTLAVDDQAYPHVVGGSPEEGAFTIDAIGEDVLVPYVFRGWNDSDMWAFGAKKVPAVVTEFEDDFEREELGNNYTVAEGDDVWSIVNNKLQVTPVNLIGDNLLKLCSLSGNFSIQADIRIPYMADNYEGFGFRFSTESDWFSLWYRGAGDSGVREIRHRKGSDGGNIIVRSTTHRSARFFWKKIGDTLSASYIVNIDSGGTLVESLGSYTVTADDIELSFISWAQNCSNLIYC